MKRKRDILLAIIILSALASLSFAQSQPPAPSKPKISEEHQGKPTPQQNERDNFQRNAILSNVTPNAKLVETKEKNQTKGTDNKPSIDWWKILFDVLLVAFTGVLAWSTIKLSRATERLWQTAQDQSKDMKESIAQTVRSADAMQSVANSMIASGERTKTAFERQEGAYQRQEMFVKMQLRAYLSVHPRSSFFQKEEAGSRIAISMTVRNTGHTPAYQITSTIKTQIMDFPLPETINLTVDPKPESLIGHIATGQEIFITAWLEGFVSEEAFAEITHQNKRRLYVFGTVLYKDAFGQEHHTNFCQFAWWDKDGKLGTNIVPHHNDAT